MRKGIQLIKKLYSRLPSGAIYTFELPSKRSTWYGHDDTEKLISDIKNKTEGDVYLGICPSSNIKTSYQRAKNKDVSALLAIVVDIDIKNDEAHKQKNLPETFKIATEWMEGLDLPPPSAIVNTGNGLHYYWFLDTPFIINSDADREKAANLNDGINRLIVSEGNKKGWELDYIGDLARVVRAPLTFNHKSDPPKPVKVLELSEQRYGFDELMSFVKPKGTQDASPISFDGFDKNGKKSNAKAQFKPIQAGCNFIQHCVEGASTVPEPSWYRFLSIVARCEDGTEICHQISMRHPKYTKEETDGKIDQALNATGPATCKYIAETIGFDGCMVCPLYHAKKLKSPITLGFMDEALSKLVGSYAYCITTAQFCEVVK